MAIQQETPIDQSFPANPNSTYPSKNTTNTIVIMTVVIAVVIGIFAMMSPKVGPANEIKSVTNTTNMSTKATENPANAPDVNPPAQNVQEVGTNR